MSEPLCIRKFQNTGHLVSIYKVYVTLCVLSVRKVIHEPYYKKGQQVMKTKCSDRANSRGAYLKRVHELLSLDDEKVENAILPTVFDIYSYPHDPSDSSGRGSRGRISG